MLILNYYSYGDYRGNFTLKLEGDVTLSMKLENKLGHPVSICAACVASLLLQHSDELARDL